MELTSIPLPTLHGAQNFRSLAGSRAGDGRRLTGHSLLRSDHLHDLTDEDWAALRGLGLRTVCDFRSADERLRHPSRIPQGDVLDVHLPVLADVRSDPRFGLRLREQPDAHGAEAMMLAVYRELPGALAPHLGRLFGLLERGEVPLLSHCTAGKDRTGFAIAVVLHALGISDEVILADYLRTAESPLMTDSSHRERLGQKVETMLGVPCSDAMMDAILGVREGYLAAAFDEVVMRYGSMDRFLLTEAALDPVRIEGLRERYLRG
jgi:protein-tyrosine phosphatase